MSKGFSKTPIISEPHHTFRVDYKHIDPSTLDEEDIETRLLKVPLRKGDATTRRYLMAAWVGCFLQSPEAEAKGINAAFLWNSEEAGKDPLGVMSTFPFEDAIQLPQQNGVNPYKALKFLSKNAVKRV